MRRLLLVIAVVLGAVVAAPAQTAPRNPHGEIRWDCQDCHTLTSWSGMREPLGFAHGETGFPLVGAHAKTNCVSCHHDLRFVETESACANCHTDIHRGQLGAECQTCHTAENWQSRREVFEQHAQRGFPLVGVHAIANCDACHVNQLPREFAGTPTDCAACHAANFQATSDPAHMAAGFSQECQSCHGIGALSWTNTTYQHPASFPLANAHDGPSCNDCHAAAYAGTSPDCFACHESDYRTAPDPDHVAAGFSTQCAECHTTIAWEPAALDHGLTSFPLTGAHVEVSCNACHTASFSGTPSACVACHESNFAAAADPDHVGGGFPEDCALCHGTAAWTPATFDHDLSDFPLSGAHVSVTCNSCHASGYTGTAGDCVACHESDYLAAADPKHVDAGFPRECAQCHSTSAWEPANLDHDLTGFPLTGAHVSVDCGSCHAGGYTGTATACGSCHESDYLAATDPNHVSAGFPAVCNQCHGTAAWRPANLNHDLTDFPLTGAHVSVTCENCHTAGYTGTASACVACHESDYTNAADPNHASAGFSTACAECHTTAGWIPASLDHDLTDFPLTGAHTMVTCNSCHTPGYTGTPLECDACHHADYLGVADPNHASAGFSTACAECHTTAGWVPASLDHDLTDFSLTGAHVSVSCNSCHSAGYTGTASACIACHEADYTSTADPDHAGAGFSTECAQCHTTTAWEPAGLDHDLTGFPLTGAHQAVACNDCHQSGYTGTASACFACHEADYVSTDDPDHAALGYPTECAQCHTTAAWEPADFDHDLTQFPLTGLHASVTCNSCHTSGYSGTPLACDACHHADYTGVVDPNHVSAGFSTACADCHTTAGWTPALLDHDITGFPLTGAHTSVTCENCHTSGYTGTASACVACHDSDYRGADDPDHIAAGFPDNCVLCHTTAGWEPANLDHNLTDFPLTGAHVSVTCENCHTSGYTGTASACIACHDSDYRGVTDPNHIAAGFPDNCVLCHTTGGWEPANLDHNLTNFPLTGAHVSVTCENCHTSGYTGTPSTCFACHGSDYQAAADPDHAAGGFPTDCAQCHTTAAWEPASFDHATTQFPLTGAHATVTCENCHASGYSGTPLACFACHDDDYNAVADPDHVSAGFGAICSECHTTSGWTPASLDHDITGFPLTGAHATVSCNSCHASGYTGTPLECDACHHADYTGVADPNHVSAGFSTACADCHTTTGWTPASLDHDITGFSLTGAHTSASCQSCHTGGFTGTPSDCYACHSGDYTTTEDPDHVAGGFSTQCAQCHTTTAWEPADFDHNLSEFPLTGAHVSVSCNSCHAAGYTGTASDCYACHQSDYAAADDPDHAAAGYSTNCTQCHTTTAWEPASFDHTSTQFPLTGAHATVTCENCHASGYSGTPLACFACHDDDYNAVADPNHVSAGFGTICSECHTTSGWTPASLNHDITGFPLTGAHLAVSCNTCHASGYTGTASECLACHQSDYTAAVNPDHNGLATDCAQCHTTTGWKPSSFNHNQTQFVLTGAHTSVSCNNCHAAGYTGTSMACFACHDDDYSGVGDPDHAMAGFSTVCTPCHNTTAWSQVSWNHNQTGFALTGAHQSVTCNSCHSTGFANTSSACYACHSSDFAGATNPDHVAGGFPTLCEQCHTTSAWTPATFDHNLTSFPLSGAHTTVTCASCHTSGYTGTPMACFACHDNDYSGVGDPDHALAGFSTVCTPCHNTTAWSQVSWNHNQTGFSLTGAHRAVTCNSCHSTGYANTSSACYACHSGEFAGATNPDHVAGGFPTLCEQCHTTSAWTPASFDHNLSGFPLTGAHTTVTCNSCHANGYTGTPMECDACHHADYLGVLDPNHVSAGFSTLCQQCHTTTAWMPASFDHNQSGFPLTGAHTTVTCNSCHASGYTGTPMECAACHNSDYLSATPDHVAAGFPTTCQTCHTTSAWTPANWDHDAQYFPIYSGAHQGKWSDCADCHVNPGNFATFECIFCHEHNQTDTDRDHTGEPGYQYLSSACYACHPRGSH